MPATQSTYTEKPFLTIVQGKLRQKVEQGTPGAVLREGKTPSGESFSKHELVFPGWEGVVLDIRIFESEYGENCNVEFEDAIISMGTDRNFFTDFVKKFASADSKQPITVSPYDFTAEDGKRKSGLILVQNGEKLKDAFVNWESGKPEYSGGFPQPGDGLDRDGWKMYFIEVKRFCKKWVEEHPINNIAAGKVEEEQEGVINRDEKNDISLGDIPF